MRVALSARRRARLPLAIGLAPVATAPVLGVVRASPAAPGTLKAGRSRGFDCARPWSGSGGESEWRSRGCASTLCSWSGSAHSSKEVRGFRWQSLRLVHGTWVATLPAPLLRGIYPLRLRVHAGGRSFRSATWLMRVFSPGTLLRPSFRNPGDVVRWWVRTFAHGTLVAFKRWRLPAWDRRDLRLHRLFVVAYDPPGQSDPGDRLGVFLTAFRDGFGARWRLLETKLLPYARAA